MRKSLRNLIIWYLQKRDRNYQLVEVKELDYLRRELEANRNAWPEYHRLKKEFSEQANATMRWAGMERLLRRNIPIRTVIDVGAADGRSAVELSASYPEAKIFCVEAEKKHETDLRNLKNENPRVDYVIAAAGDKRGEVFFGGNDKDIFGGGASEKQFEGSRRIPMTTLDLEVQERNLLPPFFVKLDTHGFEVPILEGAQKTLENTNVLLVEVYNLRLEPHARLFYEICQFLDAKGFASADIMDPLYRAKDSMLWQMDILFLRKDRPEFADVGWG